MSANGTYEKGYEDAIELYRKAESSFKDEHIQQADQYLQKALDMKPPYPKIYLLKIECDLHLNNTKQALAICNQALEILTDSKYHGTDSISDRIDLLHAKYKIYQEMQVFDKALKELENLETFLKKALAEQSITVDRYNQIMYKINNETKIIQRKRSNSLSSASQPSNRFKEAQKVLELLQDEEENDYIRTECSLVHLISANWFEKWKKYSGFYQLTGEEEEHQMDLLSPTKDPNHVEPQHPGPINSDDILEHSDILTDPDKVKEYCNYQVRHGLQENKDFLILSHNLWRYLHKIYGGFDLKRYTISLNDETQSTAVEIWLKRINVIQMPPISVSQDFLNCKLKTLYLSKKETVKDLREKLTRIYTNNTEIAPKVSLSACRLWKLDPRANYHEVLSKLQTAHGRVVVKATKLNENLVLEDAEIGDEDVIICEYKRNDEWIFISEEEFQEHLANRCAACGSSRKDLLFCECKTVKYCNQACQRHHRPLHREKCAQIKGEQNKTNEIYKQFKISKDTKFSSNSRYGLVGLQNFGNTCFMNTCLQCLSNVVELTSYFITNEFIQDINRENKLGTGGRLAAAYGNLMKELWYGSEQYISPWDIKKIIGEVASQFMGYNQQDTQEFLSYLLDGIHEDLNRVKIKPYVEVRDNEGRSDEVFAAESWENHLKRNRSIIVDLMHGQYKSKLVCPDCQKVSITFDPFSSLSLPIPTHKIVNLSLYFIYKDSALQSHLKISLSLPPQAPVSEILQNLSKILKIPEQSMELKMLREHKIIEHDTSRLDIKSLKEHEGLPFVYQIHNPSFDPPLETFNPSKMLRIEILINQEIKKNTTSDVKSFYRLLYVNREQSLKYLHLQVFAIMRAHVAHFLNNEESLAQKVDTTIENVTMALLERQYDEVLSLAQIGALPYNLYFVPKEGEDDEAERVLIPYKSDKKIIDFFSLGQKNTLTIELTLNAKIRIELFKLNKCKESDATNQLPIEPKSYSIYDCLNLFITPEILDKENTWYCSNCKDHKQATKTMELFMTPKILIIHLKRFRTNRVSSIGSFFFTSSSSKVTSLVEYPIEGLDLRNYVRGKYDKEPIYDLFAISNHYGGMGGGHYTAYCKNAKKNAWYDFNDSMVSPQDPDDLVTSAAYVLFYRRRDNDRGKSISVEPKNGEKHTKRD